MCYVLIDDTVCSIASATIEDTGLENDVRDDHGNYRFF
jgi:hypothetical protein